MWKCFVQFYSTGTYLWRARMKKFEKSLFSVNFQCSTRRRRKSGMAHNFNPVHFPIKIITNIFRQVTQMAYSSWPDHGVPDNSDEFVSFVETVRAHRQGSMTPTIVHCSAGIYLLKIFHFFLRKWPVINYPGIGRTGVLILMESALYLIEANQPVYPLDLTRVMRDQRASMIQTPAQYKFVCQAILRVYKEGEVKPLPEFCQESNSS